MRIPWNEYFMLLAKLVSLRSTCLRRQVGAVIVKDRRVLATGYNGQLPGRWHCDDNVRCWEKCPTKECIDLGVCPFDWPVEPECLKTVKGDARYCRAVHAEANAILQAAKLGIPLGGATIYCTLKPCPDCIKSIASAGIKRVVYGSDYYHDSPELWNFWKTESGLEFEELRISDMALDFVRKVLTNKE